MHNGAELLLGNLLVNTSLGHHLADADGHWLGRRRLDDLALSRNIGAGGAGELGLIAEKGLVIPSDVTGSSHLLLMCVGVG